VRKLPDLLERGANWLCVLVLAGVAAAYSLGLLGTLLEGQISSFGKGSHRLASFTREPYAFFSDLVAHLLMNGTIWYGAYWFWSTNVRGTGR
jgi:hypothetical protein